MKANKKARLIELSLALAFVLALDIGGFIWCVTQETEQAPLPDFSGLERTGIIRDGEIYRGQLLREMEPTGVGGNLMRYAGGMAILAREQDAAWIEDAVTGQKIQDIPAEWLKEGQFWEAFLDRQENLHAAVTLPDGRLELLTRYQDGRPEARLIVEKLGLKEGEKVTVQKLMADEEYYYILLGNETMKILNHKGETMQTIMSCSNFDLDKNRILYMTGNVYLLTYDMKENRAYYTVDSLILGQPVQHAYQIFCEEEKGLVYIAGASFIQAFDARSGALLKSVLNVSDGYPELESYIPGIYVDEGQTIYLTVQNRDESEIFKEDLSRNTNLCLYAYQIEPDETLNLPYTLTVTAPYRTDYMARMIQQFEKENPGQRVRYDYAYYHRREFEFQSDKDGYFDRFNIHLLLGEVGDVIMTGGTWSDVYHYFANLDLFDDLKPMLEQSETYAQLDPVELNAITIDNQIKGLPLASGTFFMHVDSEICKELGVDVDWETLTWGEMLDLLPCFEGTDYHLLDVYGDTERVFTRMIISNMPDLVDRKKGTVDLRQEWFIDLLNKWKAAEKNPHFAQGNRYSLLFGKGLISLDGKTAWEDSTELGEAFDITWNYETIGRESMAFPMPRGEKNPNHAGHCSYLYSIYNGSKNKEMAWELMDIGLRQKMQESSALPTGALNLEARQRRMAAAKRYFESPENNGRYHRFYDAIDAIYQQIDTLYDMNKIKETLYKTMWNYVRAGADTPIDSYLDQAERQILLQLYE